MNFNFLVYKMVMIIVPIEWGYCESEENEYMLTRIVPRHIANIYPTLTIIIAIAVFTNTLLFGTR